MIISDFGAMPTVEAAPVAEVATEIRNENQFFDFDKCKVQVLTLDQLKRTNRENRGDDRSCPHGIYHFALIQQVLDMCNEHGYEAEVYDLFATNNRDKQTPGVSLYPELEQRFGERAVEAHTLRRVYANIRLRNFDTEELTTNLAISYTQKGIQVGFGRNVKICHNQCMLGAGRFVSDYSARANMQKENLAGIMRTVGGWLSDAEHLVGMLMTIRVQNDTNIKSVRRSGNVYPLNQAQLTKFTESLLVRQKEEGRITAWSFYNCATDLYKPATAETNLILPQNLSMMEFMRQQEIFV